MKDGIKQILGKQISGVVVAESPRPPWMQVFIVFNDDTYFEFYGSERGFNCATGLDPGGVEEVRSYISRFPDAQIKSEFIDPGKEKS